MVVTGLGFRSGFLFNRDRGGSDDPDEIDRAPLLVVAPPGHATRTTQARWAAAPPAPRLLLLPSGPDRVHGTRSRRTKPSTQSHETPLRTAHPSKGNSTPLKRIAGTGHRWLPV